MLRSSSPNQEGFKRSLVGQAARNEALARPAERPHEEEESVERAASDRPRSVFDRFAEASSHFVSTGAFFGISVVLILLWFLIPSVDTWQLVLNTAVSVLAFVLVALLQNSERRSDLAAHRKLDAIAVGLADLMQHAVDPAASDLRARVGELQRAVGLEERV